MTGHTLGLPPDMPNPVGLRSGAPVSPAELARIRAADLAGRPVLAYGGSIGRGVLLSPADRDAVCEALTALADEVERLQAERDSTRHALQQIASAGRVWLEAHP